MRELPDMIRALGVYEELCKEPGTIARLVLPVLEHCGWPVDHSELVARELPVDARQRTGDNFDIALRTGPGGASLAAVIECKAVSSKEFRDGTKPGDGVLTLHEGVWVQPGMDRGSPNRDGLAQLRRYCANAGPALDRRHTVPVLTNGKTWVAYRMERFLENLDAPVAEDARLFEPISIDELEFAHVIQRHLGRAAIEERFRDA